MTWTVVHNAAIVADWLRPGSLREPLPGVWQVRVSLGRDPVTHRYRYAAATVRGTKRDARLAAEDWDPSAVTSGSNEKYP